MYSANPGYRVEDLDAFILGQNTFQPDPNSPASYPYFFANNTTPNTPLPMQDKQWADALYTKVLGGTSQSEGTTDLPFLGLAEENPASPSARR